MNTKVLLATVFLYPVQFATLVKAAVNMLIILGSISGFFSNLYNDLTAFALAMATFFLRQGNCHVHPSVASQRTSN